MAKIKGPLLSISASGRVGRALCFRQTRHGSTVQKPPVPTGQASPAQVAERTRMQAAARAWLSLGDTLWARWESYGSNYSKSGWNAFYQEWQIQFIEPPALPMVPKFYAED